MSISYSKFAFKAIQKQLSLINKRANGAKTHIWISNECNKQVNIEGFYNNRIRDILIVIARGVALMHVITIGKMLNIQKRD